MTDKMKYISILLLSFFISLTSFGQTKDIIQSEGITSPLHKANIGKITFMSKIIPIEDYKESDFLKSFELKENTDLNIRTFLGNSLTNYLHQLDTTLTIDELVQKGNYQFSFFIDDSLVYKENLNKNAGTSENKNLKTVFRVPLISSSNEDSWGRFLWTRFYLGNGGEDALISGTHLLKIEIRPYLKTTEIKVGNLIAQGHLTIIVPKPFITEKQIAIQPINSNSGWKISTDNYDKEKIKALNEKIVGNRFKEISSIVVIKNGKLLIEEYFNGANRNTLHDTRSVGKSFASAITGITIKDGYIKTENQTLKEFYNLKKFSNYSTKKDSVTIKSLLTMSSGFDASDENEDSPGNEEKMYPTTNWVKFMLDLPMDSNKTIGGNWDYISAGTVLLGDILNKSVPEGLEKYADKKLFKPLGITKYKWQYTPQKVANTAGSLQMNSLDYGKFGQLYKNNGYWNGKQILPTSWVKATMTNYFSQTPDQQAYGYLFWNQNYTLNDKSYDSYVCNGSGGNKIFVFTNQPLVIIITATAYNKPYAHSQIDKMMQQYILPAVLK